MKQNRCLRIAGALLAFLALCFIYSQGTELQYLFHLRDYELTPRPRPRIVVSMTSFADRIFVTGMHAIRSILAQRQPYDRFIITIPLQGTRTPIASATMCARVFGDCITLSPNASGSSVMAFLKGEGLGSFVLTETAPNATVYENAQHNITLQFLLNGDPYGPATKVLGALLLERDPETVIITVDDDISYDLSLLQVLSTFIPSHGALSSACQTRTPKTNINGMIHDASWHRYFWPKNAKACPGFLPGWASVAYRVGYFGPDVFNMTNKGPGCFFNDDVWISNYIRKRGIDLIVMPGIRGGRQLRHPTLSLSVRPNYVTLDLDPCIRFWS
jgi:hypothetical protein